MNVFSAVLVILPVLSISVLAGVIYEGPDCKRECKSPQEKAVCKYSFVVEWYYSLSKACYDCPFNLTHCDLEDCIPLNGVARSVMVVNRKLPGPTIEVCEGDTIEVDVTNNLDNAEGLSLHWHGLHATGAPYMDGVSMLTQCPISSQASFLYTFDASPPGTHWWHSHAGMQRADGLFGALIVRKAKSDDVYSRLYDYDDQVLLVNDWLHELTMERFSEYHHSIGSNKADSVLINGKGIYKTLTKETGEMANTTREVITVTRGKRYRFRTISGAVTNCGLKISVDGHRITMIASDGAAIDKQETDSFIIYAGERYDFVLHAKQDINNYWIRVNGVEGCSNVYELAILRYEGAVDENPTEPENMIRVGTTVNTLKEDPDDDDITIRDLTSRDDDDVAFSREADEMFYIGMDFNAIDNIHFNRPNYYSIEKVHPGQGTYTPQLNHISFAFPSSPPLSQFGDIPKGSFCSEATFTKLEKNCSAEYCECGQTINVTLNNVVEFVVVNEGINFDASHPMHLHGQYFRVIGFEKLGDSTTVEHVKGMDKKGTLKREPRISLKKDTIIVPDGGYVILRFHATNPGWWFFHCHLEFHVEIGMALMVHVGEQDDLPEVPTNFPKCGNFPSGGNSDPKPDDTKYIVAIVLLSVTLAIVLLIVLYKKVCRRDWSKNNYIEIETKT